jgi:uncharacterized membrane protein YdfJ with MMPL/SSD domain
MSAAVLVGAQATGGVITAAGLILAGTFLVLTALPLQVLLDFGVVAAVGVLLDTFLVRSALVPALTVALGDWALWPWGWARWRARGTMEPDCDEEATRAGQDADPAGPR